VIGQSNQKLGVFVRLPVIFLAGLVCTAAAAQGMYKCKDAAGKITYSGKECHLLGLTSAGDVTGRTSITPALKFPPSSPTPPAAAPKAASQSAAEDKEPAEPERRCFTVKTAKGTATRCNDKPEEENAEGK
jgi:hypothetical protein